jgi:hypothetical protein
MVWASLAAPTVTCQCDSGSDSDTVLLISESDRASATVTQMIMPVAGLLARRPPGGLPPRVTEGGRQPSSPSS